MDKVTLCHSLSLNWLLFVCIKIVRLTLKKGGSIFGAKSRKGKKKTTNYLLIKLVKKMLNFDTQSQ